MGTEAGFNGDEGTFMDVVEWMLDNDYMDERSGSGGFGFRGTEEVGSWQELICWDG